ncbi:hypothetical protein [Sediminitomix flava]|uniref:Uncharacterized protein n=1 Tax=Sediminitomix flava TaxID=379075 RepID=A0A315ZDS6_SEDFL|nr:hypothetical protein [Sediminitomix flava]PWJ43279.1 hypothetical protein BC781_102828 [Sediminitomix flava]
MFKKATPQDLSDAVRLLFFSAPDMLDYVFADRKTGNALAFLGYAFKNGKGLFGYKNQYILSTSQEETIALHYLSPPEKRIQHHSDTLSQIFHFYSFFTALKVAIRYFRVYSFQSSATYFSSIAFIPFTTNLEELKHLLYLFEHQVKASPLTLKTVVFSSTRKNSLEQLGYHLIKRKSTKLKNNYGKVPHTYVLEKHIFNFEIQH